MPVIYMLVAFAGGYLINGLALGLGFAGIVFLVIVFVQAGRA